MTNISTQPIPYSTWKNTQVRVIPYAPPVFDVSDPRAAANAVSTLTNNYRFYHLLDPLSSLNANGYNQAEGNYANSTSYLTWDIPWATDAGIVKPFNHLYGDASQTRCRIFPANYSEYTPYDLQIRFLYRFHNRNNTTDARKALAIKYWRPRFQLTFSYTNGSSHTAETLLELVAQVRAQLYGITYTDAAQTDTAYATTGAAILIDTIDVNGNTTLPFTNFMASSGMTDSTLRRISNTYRNTQFHAYEIRFTVLNEAASNLRFYLPRRINNPSYYDWDAYYYFTLDLYGIHMFSDLPIVENPFV
jgi:hypothetical protein